MLVERVALTGLSDRKELVDGRRDDPDAIRSKVLRMAVGQVESYRSTLIRVRLAIHALVRDHEVVRRSPLGDLRSAELCCRWTRCTDPMSRH
jgi:hypothetical protein